MPASAILAINASVQAQQASREAREAHVMQCNAFMPTFNAQTATIVQQQTYADCVKLVYPEHQDIDSGTLKFLIVCAFIGAAIGGYFGLKDKWIGDWLNGILMAIFGALIAPCIPLLFAAIFYAIKFVFS